MNKAQERHTCVICGRAFTGWGHNPEPVKEFEEGRACSDCNAMVVIPERIKRIQRNPNAAMDPKEMAK